MPYYFNFDDVSELSYEIGRVLDMRVGRLADCDTARLQNRYAKLVLLLGIVFRFCCFEYYTHHTVAAHARRGVDRVAEQTELDVGEADYAGHDAARVHADLDLERLALVERILELVYVLENVQRHRADQLHLVELRILFLVQHAVVLVDRF